MNIFKTYINNWKTKINLLKISPPCIMGSWKETREPPPEHTGTKRKLHYAALKRQKKWGKGADFSYGKLKWKVSFRVCTYVSFVLSGCDIDFCFLVSCIRVASQKPGFMLMKLVHVGFNLLPPRVRFPFRKSGSFGNLTNANQWNTCTEYFVVRFGICDSLTFGCLLQDCKLPLEIELLEIKGIKSYIYFFCN